MTAQEDERKRLARDLHDGIGQVLTALTLTLDAAENLMWSGPDQPKPLSRSAILRAQELAATALEETRDVSFRLMPARITESGLAASIRELASAAGRTIETRIDPALIRPGLLDPNVEVEAFRIVQEALGNATRHADAERVGVRVDEVGDELRLEVWDDGVGFRHGADMAGLGLAGMRERAAMIGGRLIVDSAANNGTRVSLGIRLAPHPRSMPSARSDASAESSALP
jgi:two-component system sensor histidine kinase UhpB